MTHLKRLLCLSGTALAGMLISSCGSSSIDVPSDVKVAMEKLPEKLDYTYDVKPILSDRCFACHGPDKNKQQAGLRLDLSESALAHVSEENGRNAIDPGNPGGSDLVHRILSADPELVMPTPSSHLTLSTEEKAVLIKWIEDGATYKPHWAFTKPEKATPPEVKDARWVRNDVDRFVLKKLEDKGLKPSPEADKTTLLRRVTFDLTGLPPTVSEVDAFLADQSPNAYEKVVDRLLKSKHFGENMAVSWLDMARYADTHGYQDDGLRTMWPYRDWVISAFNRNMPYDKFVTWQLAGDLLPNPNREMLLATAFNRNHQQSQEGGIVPKEYHTEYVIDRVNTFGKTFLAHTVECARCHDHKYDPISQKDFYSLYAFFNTVNEYGQIPYNGEPSPHITLPKPETEKRLKEIHKRLKELEVTYDQQLKLADTRYESWKALGGERKLPRISGRKGLIFDVRFDTLKIRPWTKEVEIKPSPEELAKNPKAQPRKETRTGIEYKFTNFANDTMPMQIRGDMDHLPKMVRNKDRSGVFLPGETYLEMRGFNRGDRARMPDNTAWFNREDPFAIGLWVNIRDPKLDGPLFNRHLGPMNGFRGYECVRLPDGRLAFRMSYVWPDDAMDVETFQQVPLKHWTHIAVSYDGSGSAKGIRIYLNGKPAPVRIMTDNLTQGVIWGKDKSNWGAGTNNLSIGQSQDHNYRGFAVSELKVYNRPVSGWEIAKWVKGPRAAPATRQQVFEHYTFHYDEPLRRIREERSALLTEENELMNHEIDVMVMREQKYPRPTYLLKRGAYDAPGEEVKAMTPEILGQFPQNLPKNRLGLAQWLLSADNPLFARVVVNRFWQQLFGNGIVKTSDDFGNQGELPSHPELLDYLAVDFRESGWNVKRLFREIALSATYRQRSSASEQLREADPDNRLLARGPSYRYSAEQVRDNALASSGLLTQKIGGPSVKPYQPAGIWEALATRNAVNYVQDHGDSLYRRSMYTIWKRSSPPPMMLNFDAAERHFCVVRRQKTSTPLQALVVMNDPQFVEASRVLAQRMMKQGGASIDDQIRYAYKALTSRLPRQTEMDILKNYFSEEKAELSRNPRRVQELLTVGEFPNDPALDKTELAARMMLATTLMNADEFVIKR
jgi:hypothetical protein